MPTARHEAAGGRGRRTAQPQGPAEAAKGGSKKAVSCQPPCGPGLPENILSQPAAAGGGVRRRKPASRTDPSHSRLLALPGEEGRNDSGTSRAERGWRPRRPGRRWGRARSSGDLCPVRRPPSPASSARPAPPRFVPAQRNPRPSSTLTSWGPTAPSAQGKGLRPPASLRAAPPQRVSVSGPPQKYRAFGVQQLRHREGAPETWLRGSGVQGPMARGGPSRHTCPASQPSVPVYVAQLGRGGVRGGKPGPTSGVCRGGGRARTRTAPPAFSTYSNSPGSPPLDHSGSQTPWEKPQPWHIQVEFVVPQVPSFCPGLLAPQGPPATRTGPKPWPRLRCTVVVSWLPRAALGLRLRLEV